MSLKINLIIKKGLVSGKKQNTDKMEVNYEGIDEVGKFKYLGMVLSKEGVRRRK